MLLKLLICDFELKDNRITGQNGMAIYNSLKNLNNLK